MLLEWHRQDPVSAKETARNEAVYALQKNRNPYIDHPELAEYVWGNKTSEKWSEETGSVKNPVITSPTSGTTIDFGNVAAGQTKQMTVTVKGNDLSQALTLAVSNSAFTLSNTSISAANANSGYTVTITYKAPTTATSSAATLTISSSEISTATRVSLSGQSVTGIPAQAATNVTASSFQANWTNIGITSNYILTVYESDGYTVHLSTTVTASDEQYEVTGLEASTKYYYRLTTASGTLTSGYIEVTTFEKTPFLSLQTNYEDGFNLTGIEGKLNPVLHARVYAENIEEFIEVAVTGNFELSVDKKSWSSSILLDNEGENFYVRFSDYSEAGEFEGVLTASTRTLTGVAEEITGTILSSQATTTVEDWEGLATGGYWTTEVQGDAFKWNFVDAGIWADTPKRDKLNCRLGKESNSSITMAEDIKGGVSRVSFYAAYWSGDSQAKLTLSYSTDQGTTWTKIQDFTISKSGSLTQYSTSELSIKTAARFRLAQSSGKRVILDDIAFTGIDPTTDVVKTVADPSRDWDAYAAGANLILESPRATRFEIYNLEAQLVKKMRVSGRASVSLPAGVYIIVADNASTKVIIR